MSNCLDSDFYVKDGISYLESKGVMVDKRYPVLDSISVVKSGVIFQQYCHNGLKYDVCVSWLQKAVRRQLRSEAIHCATQMILLGRMFESHCLNRLLLIASEDIGPAEPQIATRAWQIYKEIQSIRDSNRTETYRLVMQLIDILCQSRKTRLMDWLCWNAKSVSNCHLDDDDLVKMSLEELVAIFKTAFHKKPSSINALMAKMERLSLSRDKELRQEIRSLKEIYGLRQDLLFALHALYLFKNDYPYKADPELLIRDLNKGKSDLVVCQEWTDLQNSELNVMDDAIDMHTKDGAKLLKRDAVHFICKGSIVTPWTELEGEREAIQKSYDTAIEKLGYGRIKTDITPRKYQVDIVKQLVNGYRDNNNQFLEMACGTGKTKTSWWTVRDTLKETFKMSKVLVVTPLLGILSQFYESWRDMAITDKVYMEGHILASDFGKPLGSMYTNYTRISDKEELDELEEILEDDDSKLRVVFTTYSSLPKIRHIAFDFVVYDEAHYFHKQIPNAEYSLSMSATFPKKVIPDVRYGYGDAISNGAMSDYEVVLLEPDQGLEEVMEQQDKVIVFSRTNKTSRNAYKEYLASDPEGEVMIVSNETRDNVRKNYFKRFSNAMKAVIFNCRVMGMGIDLPECDAIYIESGCTSYVSVIQAMGRCLRLSNNKSIGRIYMNSSDSKVETRLKQMRTVDGDVDSKVKEMTSIQPVIPIEIDYEEEILE